MVEAAGADIVDINFGCPVQEGDEDRCRRDAARGPRPRVPASSRAVADAVDAARVREDAARRCERLAQLPRRRARASSRPARASLTLHPRSAQQMYTGTADHALTAELVSLVDVPVIASGDIDVTRAGAGRARDDRRRGRDGRPRRTGQPVGAARDRRRRRRRADAARRSSPSSSCSSARPCASSASARVRLPEEVLRLVPRARPVPEAFKQELVLLDRRRRSSGGCSRQLPARSRSSSGSRPRCRSGDEVTLDAPDLDLRRRLTSVRRPCGRPDLPFPGDTRVRAGAVL